MKAALIGIAFVLLLSPTAVRAEVVGHPEGCPRRAFCGCGASVHLFGRPVRDLFLARNWLRFPRAAPGYNMAAVRRGHVFILKEQLADKVWRVFDANSGGRMTRIHERSIAGYTIVDPRSYASAGENFSARNAFGADARDGRAIERRMSRASRARNHAAREDNSRISF